MHVHYSSSSVVLAEVNYVSRGRLKNTELYLKQNNTHFSKITKSIPTNAKNQEESSTHDFQNSISKRKLCLTGTLACTHKCKLCSNFFHVLLLVLPIFSLLDNLLFGFLTPCKLKNTKHNSLSLGLCLSKIKSTKHRRALAYYFYL